MPKNNVHIRGLTVVNYFRELQRIQKLSTAICEDVTFQHSEMQKRREKFTAVKALRDRVEKDLQDAKAACRVVQDAIDAERAQYNRAIEAKDSAIKKLVTQDKVSQISVPTLELNVKQNKKSGAKKAKKYSEQLWYVGAASREDCEAQLMQDRCTPGQFLVRDGSNAATAPFSLSIRVTGASGKGEVKHFRCLKQPNGKLQLGQKVSADSVFHQL
eukprot:m.190720 g.190720  ORF g.190720 m.190720 type:complete len:215 (-) comp18570_c1_seq5:279-923(-)